jgi:hypothetical protein
MAGNVAGDVSRIRWRIRSEPRGNSGWMDLPRYRGAKRLGRGLVYIRKAPCHGHHAHAATLRLVFLSHNER